MPLGTQLLMIYNMKMITIWKQKQKNFPQHRVRLTNNTECPQYFTETRMKTEDIL